MACSRGSEIVDDNSLPASRGATVLRAGKRFFGGPLGASTQVLLISLAMGLLVVGVNGAPGFAQATLWVILGIFAISLDVLWGYCGILSFGQAAFFGLGAYAYTWLTTDQLGMNMHASGPIVGLLAGILVPALFAVLLGYFLFYGRVAGAYFAVVTLTLSFLLQLLGSGWNRLFGGSTGISGVPSLPGLGDQFTMKGLATSFAVMAVAAALVAALTRMLLRSSFGLTVDGVRDNEDRLVMLGSKTVQTKLVIFAVSAAIAGFAGALYASQANFVSSDLMGALLSTEAVVWVAVGGRGTLVGGFIGALVVSYVGFGLSSVAVNYWNLILGGLFIIVVLFGSSGVVGLVRWSWGRACELAARNR
jgi:urea transport system permease protein